MNSTVDAAAQVDTSQPDKRQQMLDFALYWFPLGGGSAQRIDEQFGMSDREFFTEIDRLVAAEPPSSLTKSELRRLREVIRRRLWIAR